MLMADNTFSLYEPGYVMCIPLPYNGETGLAKSILYVDIVVVNRRCGKKFRYNLIYVNFD